MSASRVSRATDLSSSRDDRRQAQARIRALQQRTNALYEELSRSSTVADSTVHQINLNFEKITDEFQEQRDQLLRQIHHVKQNIQQSTKDLKGVRKNLTSAQSFHLTTNSPRQTNPIEVQEMNAMIDDIERVLQEIAQQLKQYRFKPVPGTKLGKIESIKPTALVVREQRVKSSESSVTVPIVKDRVSVHKLYTVDLDISADWVIGSIEERIFVCNKEGEVRTYAYSRLRRRQPLIVERFHLSNIRLITSFTATDDYLVAFELDTRLMMLYTHHGGLLIRMKLYSEPNMIVRCFNGSPNSIWICSRMKRQCFQYNLNHRNEDLQIIDELNFTQAISKILVDPVGISSDERARVAVHDVNSTTSDRILIYENHQDRAVPLDFIKYADRQLTSRIERVLLVPTQTNLIVLIYAPQVNINRLHEVVVVDIESQPAQVLYRIAEIDGIESIDLTMNGELIYSVTPPSNKRILPKIHIYSLLT